jgi:sugar lactone lactonase YvrE
MLNKPYGVALDGVGRLYISDTDNHRIRKVTAAGDVTSIGGLDGTNGDADGTGTAARFDKPSALTINGAGTVFVIDTNNCRVSKSTSTTKSNAAPAWPASSLTRTPSCASSPPS